MNHVSTEDWRPDSWRGRAALQQPSYRDTEALTRVTEALAALPPLVTSWEVEALKSRMALAQQGEAFILQGGDCA